MKPKQTGIYKRRPKDEVKATHAAIVDLKRQGLPLTKIAEKVGTTYGSVLYTIYRKENNGLWQ